MQDKVVYSSFSLFDQGIRIVIRSSVWSYNDTNNVTVYADSFLAIPFRSFSFLLQLFPKANHHLIFDACLISRLFNLCVSEGGKCCA